jgi:hypothetical protein
MAAPLATKRRSKVRHLRRSISQHEYQNTSGKARATSKMGAGLCLSSPDTAVTSASQTKSLSIRMSDEGCLQHREQRMTG